MIIARICLPGGKRLFHGSVEIEGSPAGDDYRQGGWFPVDSFNFGFNEKQADKADDKPDATNPAAKGSTGRPGSNVPSKTASPGAGDKDAFSSMQIAKEVDRATCELMVLAMEERSKKKGAPRGDEKNTEYHADIHVLGSVALQSSGNVERNIFPSLMIHLEGVHVTQWSISGSGENRPTESVTLLYDRAAMHYMWTGDGRTFVPSGTKGWDQGENKQFPNEKHSLNIDGVIKKYLPSPFN